MNHKEIERLSKSFYSAWFASRVMGLGLLIMTCAFLSVCTALLYLMPLKELKPFLVSSYNKDSQVVNVEPLEVNTSSMQKLLEIKCREFVVDLHTFDGQTEAVRLKRLHTMTEDGEVIEYLDNFLNIENQNSDAKKLKENNVTRSVSIKHLNNLAPEAPNMWQVNWVLVETEKDGSQRFINCVSVVTAEAKERKLFAGEDDINPIGFTVTQYKMRVLHD
jgi:type IV secretion system protein VirB8